MADAAAATQRSPLGNLKHFALSTPWLGQFYALTPVYTILLQVQVSETVGTSLQNTAVGLATGLGGVVALVPTLWAAAGEGLKPLPRRPRPSIAEFVAPLYKGDFGWAFFTRLLTVSGLYSVLPFLVFAFRDIEGIKDSANFTAIFELI